MSNLPSLANVLSALYASQRSSSSTLYALVQHVVDAGPSITFPILTPIRYLVTAFDNGIQDALCEFNVLLRLGMDPIEHGPLEPNECIQKSSYIQLRKHYIHARDELIPAIETNLTKIEPLLITELHGSYELELFLRFIKKIPWFSSARIDLLDNIPTIFSSLRSSLRAVLVCFEYVEHHAHNFLTCFLDVDWANRQRGRTDLLWCLQGTPESLIRLNWGLCTYTKMPGYLLPAPGFERLAEELAYLWLQNKAIFFFVIRVWFNVTTSLHEESLS
ncbi:uncharacterized protein ARMOST_21178 [Armillaria ostoyae]|uniref:Uncharacterized protein n=1 Tax=Armillaria ostoyae TaxID=47428 RepID=A0A284S9C8_ARMOS|nr:uncharacterized protein ARMOST_21178 [Armillaria ostoyae]